MADSLRDTLIEQMARAFHDNYERLAPEHGYVVRPDVGQRSWDELPENNRSLMLATVDALLASDELVIVSRDDLGTGLGVSCNIKTVAASAARSRLRAAALVSDKEGGG